MTDKVNLNDANREELLAVPGMDEATVDAILSWRANHHGFRSVKQLKTIPGFDKGRFERIKDFFTLA